MDEATRSRLAWIARRLKEVRRELDELVPASEDIVNRPTPLRTFDPERWQRLLSQEHELEAEWTSLTAQLASA